MDEISFKIGMQFYIPALLIFLGQAFRQDSGDGRYLLLLQGPLRKLMLVIFGEFFVASPIDDFEPTGYDDSCRQTIAESDEAVAAPLPLIGSYQLRSLEKI